MKKRFLIFILLIFIVVSIKSQDTVRLKHTNYTSVFSKSKKYPVLVEWWMTKAKVHCTKPMKRNDNFKPDPLLPKETDLDVYYKNSGFDRGHMMAASYNLCQTVLVQDECFYFSNMSPQYHSLNAGDWKSIEIWSSDMVKKYDSVYIWSGNLGVLKKIGTVSVPKQLWKVVYIKKTKEYYAFLCDNTDQKPKGMNSTKLPKEEIEKLTGFKFRINVK